MKLFLLIGFIGLVYGDCPAWRPFRPMSECLWLRGEDGKISGREMMEGFINACGITLGGGKSITDLPDIPLDLEFPDKCGYCAFKVECRNRDGFDDGCFPIDTKKHVCTEHSDVCDMPQVPRIGGCEWAMMGSIWAQCTTSRYDLPEFKREGFRKGSKFFPQQNCIKKGDRCACCCHPFKPSSDGTRCVAVPAKPTCEEFGEYNDWSECLWWPLENVIKGISSHCWGKEKKTPKVPKADTKGMLPPGFTPPPKCGFCSFKLRCKKRDAGGKPGCFPVKGDKMVCGPDDCDTCGEVCTLPKLGETAGELGQCDWSRKLLKIIKMRGKTFMKSMKNYWKKRGFMQIAQYLPHGSCKEIGDECKCCCHPYEPNEDGSQCILKNMCKLPSDMGFTWNVEA